MRRLAPLVTPTFISAVLLCIPTNGEAVVAPAQATGRLTLLRVHDVGTKYGRPPDQIDVEVVVWLDSKPGKAFGFQLRNDSGRPTHQGMLDLLRDAFNNNLSVTIDYVGADLGDPDPQKRNFVIIRAWLTATREAEARTLQYAVKFACGATDGKDGLAPGRYYTGINVHNPWEKTIKFKKKFAIGLPLQQVGRYTQFVAAGLDYDEAFEIECREIFQQTAGISTAGFRTGFAVIESVEELDVVAIYTAAPVATDQVSTQEVERVAPRRIVQELPDLVPVPDGTGTFCRRSGSNLVVTVRNRGAGSAGPSKTEVDFFSLGQFTVSTQALAAQAPIDLLVNPPAAFWTGEGTKEFEITADSMFDVTEANEGNNTASGVCTVID
jgi:hypothetical protein